MSTESVAPPDRRLRPPDPSVGDALRLVRLRVALAMAAMAILPIALVGVVLPALSGPSREAEARISASSAGVSSALAAELGRARSALLIVAADPGLRSFVAGTGKPSADTVAGLTSIAGILGPLVPSATVEDAKGTQRLRIDGGRPAAPQVGAHPDDPILLAVRALPPDGVYRSEPYLGPNGSQRVTLAVPIAAPGAPATAPPAGAVRFELSLRQLLATSQAGAIDSQGYALIVDARSGSVIVDTRESATGAPSPAAPSSDLGNLLPQVGSLISGAVSRAGRAWATLFGNGWGVGLAPISVAVPGFADWTVVVVEPSPANGVPLGLLAAAFALIAATALLAIWMARQILHPAEELERSRGELQRLYEVARRDALIDALTGLGNHRAFQEAFGRELEQARRHRYPVALMLFDLDDFKRVNDNLGHAAGDAVLAAFGASIGSCIRRGDAAFRIGGDEFAVVMPHTDAPGAEVVARRLLTVALEPSAGTSASRAPTSFSAGIAAAPDHGAVPGELSARADAALYWGKRHGRTMIEIYDPSRHRAQLPSSVADADAAIVAVASGRLLRPVFQPIVSLLDGRIVGFEGLVRPLPESGFADASALFAAAEATGRSMELDWACLDVVAAAAARIDGDSFISLNISPRSLEAPDFSAGAIRATLARYGLAPARVVLEVTERETIEALDRLQTNLAACRTAGFRIAADDVGAGNAGLRLLSTVRFDIVKVDLSLVHEGALRDPALSVLRSLVEMAGQWGALVVAEGIETGSQLRVMRALHVSAAQGYLLGRPSDNLETGAPIDLDTLEDEGGWPPPALLAPRRVAQTQGA